MLAFLLLLDTQEERSEFETLYYNYHMMVYRAAYSVLKDEYLAQDAAQITFLKIARKYDKIRSQNVLDEKAYIYRMAINAAKDMLDKEQQFVNAEDDVFEELIDDDVLIEDAIIRIENYSETIALLDEINPSYGEIIYLKYFRELDNQEIGDLLDLKVNAVRVKLHRAINALKEVVGKELAVNE